MFRRARREVRPACSRSLPSLLLPEQKLFEQSIPVRIARNLADNAGGLFLQEGLEVVAQTRGVGNVVGRQPLLGRREPRPSGHLGGQAYLPPFRVSGRLPELAEAAEEGVDKTLYLGVAPGIGLPVVDRHDGADRDRLDPLPGVY